MPTHTEYMKLVNPARPCTANDWNVGGGCFNCGWDPMKIASPSPGPWKIQSLGSRPGYPNWYAFAIRSKENVHIATVGNVDRYFEGREIANAELMVKAPELAEENKALRKLCEKALVALDAFKGNTKMPVTEKLMEELKAATK